MTERLYYCDSSLLKFEAMIVEQGEHEGKSYAVLDKSAFYPTSGGQLHDTGTLNGIAIIDVIETDTGQVWHISDKPVGKIGDTIRGVIDKDRRYMHRQMHTAQHILSQAFIRLYGYETVSVHLGREYAAVELDAKQVSLEQVASTEKMAQEVVAASYPVEILFIDSNEAVNLPLRKVPMRKGTIRVIRIGEFDWSACGGTHCNNTAEVVVLKITGVEKMRGRSLVKFLAGRQALDDYHNRFSVTSQLSQQFTCHVNNLVDKVSKLAADNDSMRKEIVRLQKELMPVWAEELAAEAQTCGACQLVCREIELSDDRYARQLAGLVAGRIEGVVLLLASGRLLVVVSPESKLHAGHLVKQFCELTGLRGGGSDALAQIGGAEKEKMAHYKEVIGKLLRDG